MAVLSADKSPRT